MLSSERAHFVTLYNSYVAQPTERNFRPLRDYALLDSFSFADPVVCTSIKFISALGRHFALFSQKESRQGDRKQLATHLDKRVFAYLNALRSSSPNGSATLFIV